MQVFAVNNDKKGGIEAAGDNMFLALYNILWATALPFLACSSRLREGWTERLFAANTNIARADIWVQAASAGEAYLATQLIQKCNERGAHRIFITSSTSQGLTILRNCFAQIGSSNKRCTLGLGYFPFDMPLIIAKALDALRPRVFVVLETELWPGVFAQCKRRGIPVLIINGRLSKKSLKGHLYLARFWNKYGPSRVMAISDQDAKRFSTLFPKASVTKMKNMKFDRISFEQREQRTFQFDNETKNNSPLVILASIRKEEEPDILKAIVGLFRERPEVTIALFPRHMHRIRQWIKLLKRAGIEFVLRSEIRSFCHPSKVILWDVFGELANMYSLATAAFVGGTLRPCGGQNFLEALGAGIVPCIGPYWDNFLWIGREIVEKGLVREVRNVMELVKALSEAITQRRPKEEVISQATSYIKERQGGTDEAWYEITRWLNRGT